MSCPLVCDLSATELEECCLTVIDRRGWKKILVNVAVVLFYQVLRACYEGEECICIDKQARSSYMFLIAATVWLTALDLQPACLNIWPSFMLAYDILAVTVFANLLLNYIWSEILLFVNTFAFHLYTYSEDSKLGEIVQYIFDKEDGLICLADVVAFTILVWVLYGLGVLCNFQIFFHRVLSSLQDDECNSVDEEVAKRLVECCAQINWKDKKKNC